MQVVRTIRLLQAHGLAFYPLIRAFYGGSQNFRSVQGGVVLPATRKSYVLTFPGLSSQGDTKPKNPTKNMLSN